MPSILSAIIKDIARKQESAITSAIRNYVHEDEKAIKRVRESLTKKASGKEQKESEQSQGMATIKSFINTEAPKQAKLSLAEKLAIRKKEQEDAAEALGFGSTNPDEALPSHILMDAEDSAEGQEVETYEGAFSLNITLNERQLLAKEFALAGKDYCFIGAAGTGKTTTQRSVAETLLQSKSLGTSKFKKSGSRIYVDAPSIAFCAYTRRASANLQRAIHKSPELAEALKHNIMTIHALLEFEPVTYYDDAEQKEKFRFEPMRTAANPLNITHLIIEEASMLGLDLWQQLYDALPYGVQIIFIGDINQLPPVFGASILNYALVQLPVVELTEVYRNGGIILENAHRILKGELPLKETEDFVIVRGKNPQQVGQNKMAYSLGTLFKTWYELVDTEDGKEERYYDPEDCIILSPFNKQDLGTDNMNKWISQFLGEKRGAIVHEVIAGYNKLYLAVGDKVMFNKQDGEIIEIKRNGLYHGKEPQAPGSDLTRFGARVIGGNGKQDAEDIEDLELGYDSFSLEALEEQAAERKMQCSHTVVLKMETDAVVELSAVGDFGPQVFSLGYVLTVHKAQGCEWRKVFILMHNGHSVLLTRELFYTAVTRAREGVVIIAKDYVIEKAVTRQTIKGNSLADKLEYFNSGAVMQEGIVCSKKSFSV